MKTILRNLIPLLLILAALVLIVWIPMHKAAEMQHAADENAWAIDHTPSGGR